MIMQEERTAEQWSQAERSEAESCNGFCEAKMIVLLVRRHDSEEAICLYTLTYIDTRELASRKEGIVLQSDCKASMF